MTYKAAFTSEFLKTLKKLKKRDLTLFNRLVTEITEILDSPERYKALKGSLRGLRRAHVRPFVVVFKVGENTVTFVSFKHHDKAYK